MKLREIMDRKTFEEFRKPGTSDVLLRLTRALTPISNATLINHNNEFFSKTFDGPDRPAIDSPAYVEKREAFFTEQEKKIRECVKIELTPLGQSIRKGFGLEPLTMDTEI